MKHHDDVFSDGSCSFAGITSSINRHAIYERDLDNHADEMNSSSAVQSGFRQANIIPESSVRLYYKNRLISRKVD